MPLEDWIQHYGVARFLYDWQTVIAGLLALGAAAWTIRATRSTAKEQIDASRADADRVIAAARAQTEATFKQTETTVDLQRMRDASEALAFHTMLEAAMTRILAEADWARKAHPGTLKQTADSSVSALAVRECITKGAFAELRATCVRRGGSLTGEFLDLEREIDSFASQWELGMSPLFRQPIRRGKHAGLDEQLALIEAKAAALRQKAFEAFDKI
jgi:hypothetical protein